MKQPAQPQRQAKISAAKAALHPSNPHQSYDMQALQQSHPALGPYLIQTPRGELSIDFSNADAVKHLNQALLIHHHQLPYWDLPTGYLCPPVPGRLDYLLYLSDLLKKSNLGKAPKSTGIRLLDIGCGANLIYPLLAVRVLGWQVLASEVDGQAVAHAQQLMTKHGLDRKITLRQPAQAQDIFDNLLHKGEYIDVTMCNPPFHSSAAEAQRGSERKLHNLGLTPAQLNFAGQAHELWCEGGELAFIKRMITQSKAVATQVYWFSCLVSKQAHLAALQQALTAAGVSAQHCIAMAQGNKQSRFLAWTFLNPAQQQLWRQHRW